ncbi:MAG: aldo/keto reductase [Pseudomonadota bacterium]|nr:aldo/keto reductase [Pseudomonadota bacterium]
MQQVTIGQDGRRVGVLGFGCWRFAGHDLAEAETLIETALDLGMTLVDTADIYGFGGEGFGAAETLLGRVLNAAPARRERMFLASKGGIIPPVPYNSSRAYLVAACEASLARLGVEQIDLYQIHRPDLLTPWQEVAGALDTLLAHGKIGAVGVSNFTVAQTRALQAHLGSRIVSTQPEFSALHRQPLEDGTLDWCQETGAAALVWSPLAGGRLGETYLPQPEDPPTLGAVQETLDRIATLYDVRRSDVALAFLLKHPARPIVLLGTQRPERLAAARQALSVPLSRQQWYSILEAARGAPMP